MSIPAKIIEHSRETVHLKGMGELNLVRGEADRMSLQKKWELSELLKNSGSKITPTEFIVADKLTQVLNDLGLNWENLEKSRQDLFTKMVLQEPREDLAQKIPTANALYQKLAEDDWWEKANQAEQNQMLNQISNLAHLAELGANALNLKNVLDASSFENADGFTKFLNLKEALQTANLIKTAESLVNLEKTMQVIPQKNEMPTPVSLSSNVEQMEENRIKEIFEQQEKIDFSARAQLSGKVEIPTQQKKSKSKNEKLRNAYSQAEKQAQEHLLETVEKENKNLKEQHKEQKRFTTTETVSEGKKDRKILYAGLLTGSAIGGTMLAGWFVS